MVGQSQTRRPEKRGNMSPEPGEQQHKRGRLSSVGRDNDVVEGPLPSAQRFSRSFHRNKRFVEGAHGLLIDAVGATTLGEDAGTGELLSHLRLFRPKLTSIANNNDTHGATSTDKKMDSRPQEAQSTSTGFSASVTNIEVVAVDQQDSTKHQPSSGNHNSPIRTESTTLSPSNTYHQPVDEHFVGTSGRIDQVPPVSSIPQAVSPEHAARVKKKKKLREEAARTTSRPTSDTSRSTSQRLESRVNTPAPPTLPLPVPGSEADQWRIAGVRWRHYYEEIRE